MSGQTTSSTLTTGETDRLDPGSIGDPAETRRALAEAIRADPTDQRARMFLFQLLCVEGVWDKARLQLRALSDVSPEAMMLASAYGQTIDAERARAAGLEGAAAVTLLADAKGWATGLAAALSANPADADALRTAALDACPDTPGEIDGEPFDFLYDGDSRFGPTIEAIVAGRWGLLPFSAIEEIRTEGPVDLRDLVWLPAELRLRNGTGLAAMLPVRYPGSEQAADADLRLSRRTEWQEAGDGGVRGLGQRVWTTSGGVDVPILSFRRIRFGTPG